uniref:Uncharacterized protein n=1 Tax=Microcebus murinus TaxID=30608 RepID=A0A8C5XSU9_MICMU
MVLSHIPFFSIPVVLTLTNVIHNLAMAWLLTHWEQMDYGLQFTFSLKFLSISPPIVLFLLVSFYTKYDDAHFLINTASLLSVLLPKLSQCHRVRVFGTNKYSGMGLGTAPQAWVKHWGYDILSFSILSSIS